MLSVYIRYLQLYIVQKIPIRQVDSLSVANDNFASWSYLFTQYGYGDNQDGATGAKSYPLDYVYSGRYFWDFSRLYIQGVTALLWSSSTVSSTLAYSLRTWSAAMRPVEPDGKTFGYALRCVSRY